MNILSIQGINSLKFYYSEEENNIKYEVYSFNEGINITTIEIDKITHNSLEISWKPEIPEIIKNLNINVEFIIEMRKENKDENFKKIYKGYLKTINLIALIPDTIYEFRICSVFKENKGSWSKIKQAKTLRFKIESKILGKTEDKNIYVKKLFEWTKTKNMDLIYRGNKDEWSNRKFHDSCDNKGPTVVLFKNKFGIFGGFASISWQDNGEYKSAPYSFIFTLINIYGTEPTKFPSQNDGKEVFHEKSHGPWFGLDIFSDDDSLKKSSYTSFPSSYKDVLEKGKSIFTGDNNSRELRIEEIEIFKCDLFKAI